MRYLIVDGHSIIFAWSELRKLHARRPSLAREALIKELRQYQDWTGVNVAVVFDGRGARVSEQSDRHDVQIFYAHRDQSADAIIVATREQVCLALRNNGCDFGFS